MRKILILIVALFMLTGCGNKTYDEISYDELNRMLDDKQDFFVYKYMHEMIVHF